MSFLFSYFKIIKMYLFIECDKADTYIRCCSIVISRKWSIMINELVTWVNNDEVQFSIDDKYIEQDHCEYYCTIHRL